MNTAELQKLAERIAKAASNHLAAPGLLEASEVSLRFDFMTGAWKASVLSVTRRAAWEVAAPAADVALRGLLAKIVTATEDMLNAEVAEAFKDVPPVFARQFIHDFGVDEHLGPDYYPTDEEALTTLIGITVDDGDVLGTREHVKAVLADCFG